MKRVLLLATGDTIAFSGNSLASGKELLAAIGPVPARVVAEDVMAEPSWDTSAATMLALARRVRKALREDGFDGVVVTNGTDTLEETAYLTDLLAGPGTGGGIVFTGAVRGLSEPDSDGPRNLADAITAAADPVLRHTGAVVCFGGELHAARWARLADTTRDAAFSSAPHPVLGRISGDSAEISATPPVRPPLPAGEPESDVALVKTYPGMPANLLTTVTDAGARGVVLEGTGAGNVPVELFSAIMELTSWDIPVVVASRAHTRPVPLEDLPYANGLAGKTGAIGARGLAPGHARVALMVALGGGGVDYVREWFSLL